jgi:glycosyltransferase involved in cell wall biosynthesis
VKKVSVIIPFFNCPFVAQAIDSVLNQTYKNIEIIVVNDGSTKNAEKIKPYLNQIDHYIEKPNGGTGSALNQGIKRATGDYFAWLSSDDRFHPEKIQKQLEYMETHKLKVSYTSYSLIDSNNLILKENIGVWFNDRLLFLNEIKKGCFINGCTVMLAMEVFSKVGFFDESLSFTQDYDFWLRILKEYHFHYIDEILLWYREHEGMGTKKNQERIVKEIKLVQSKHHDELEKMIKAEQNIFFRR